MKRIEEAARKFYNESYGPKHDPEDIFVAGARYVLDAMTSEAAVRKASESQAVDDEGAYLALGDLIGFSGENKTRTVVLAALAAVRKEIEGE